MDRSNLDFDTFFDQEELQESTRVSGVLKKMKSDENLDLIFENITRRRYKKFLGAIAGLAFLIFAVSFDGLQTYRDAVYAGVENALVSVTDKETVAESFQFVAKSIEKVKSLLMMLK